MAGNREYLDRLKEEVKTMVAVKINGHEHMAKQTLDGYGDTFNWVAGPGIRDFCRSQGIRCLMERSSNEPDASTFYFESKDIAALFKLTFA